MNPQTKSLETFAKSVWFSQKSHTLGWRFKNLSNNYSPVYGFFILCDFHLRWPFSVNEGLRTYPASMRSIWLKLDRFRSGLDKTRQLKKKKHIKEILSRDYSYLNVLIPGHLLFHFRLTLPLIVSFKSFMLALRLTL